VAAVPPTSRAAAVLLAGLALTACSSTTSATACSGTTCTLTLKGTGAAVDVLGQHVALTDLQDGRATVSLGGRSLTCTEGQSVDAGPLTLSCSHITPDSVELRASLG
jgi:hypothetical protein